MNIRTTAQYCFKSADIQLLIDDKYSQYGKITAKPTKREIFNAMTWLVKGAETHDSLFFYCETMELLILLFFSCSFRIVFVFSVFFSSLFDFISEGRLVYELLLPASDCEFGWASGGETFFIRLDYFFISVAFLPLFPSRMSSISPAFYLRLLRARFSPYYP